MNRHQEGMNEVAFGNEVFDIEHANHVPVDGKLRFPAGIQAVLDDLLHADHFGRVISTYCLMVISPAIVVEHLTQRENPEILLICQKEFIGGGKLKLLSFELLPIHKVFAGPLLHGDQVDHQDEGQGCQDGGLHILFEEEQHQGCAGKHDHQEAAEGVLYEELLPYPADDLQLIRRVIFPRLDKG